MIYAWRYPNSVGRSAMIGVNPPGNFLYSGTEIDQGIERYSALCAQDPACRARTGNLAASMQHTAANMPSRWYFLPIKPGNALVGTFLGLTDETSGGGGVLAGPNTLDSWISAAHGDPGGLWLLSEMAGLILPSSFVWGEFASIGLADAQPAARYFSSGADRGSIIGNPFTEFLWGAGGLADWPANPGENQYTSVQNSNVPTLLIGGTLDFQTPAQNATKELLPHLPNGHQVILSGLGHAEDFWSYEPSASTRLLTTFYNTGRVDTSRYTPNKVSFTTSSRQTAVAKDILAVVIGLALLAALSLLWVARRVRKHGAAGRKTSVATRTIVPLVLGLGGWFGAALVVLTFWPALFLSQRTARDSRHQRADRAGPLPGLDSPRLGPCHQVTRAPGRNRRRPARRVARVHRGIRAVRARHHHDRSCCSRQPRPDRRQRLPRTVRARPWQRPRRNLRRSDRSGQPRNSRGAPWRRPPRLRRRPVTLTVMILRAGLRLPGHRDHPDGLRRP